LIVWAVCLALIVSRHDGLLEIGSRLWPEVLLQPAAWLAGAGLMSVLAIVLFLSPDQPSGPRIGTAVLGMVIAVTICLLMSDLNELIVLRHLSETPGRIAGVLVAAALLLACQLILGQWDAAEIVLLATTYFCVAAILNMNQVPDVALALALGHALAVVTLFAAVCGLITLARPA